MKIAVVSGKGGTGKTLVSTSLAKVVSEIKKVKFLDLDVEEPNSYIFLRPEIEKEEPVNLLVPRVNYELCDFCGVCQEVCEFNAIYVFKNARKISVFDELCKGCGACKKLCPKQAIYQVPRNIGKIRIGHTSNGIEFFEGRLNIGEINAVFTISEVKRRAFQKVENNEIAIMDAPPGTSCPVIKVMEDSDFVVLVAEPTPFGFWDFRLTYEVVKKMRLKAGVVINKDGIGNQELENFLKENRIKILLKIPFKKDIAKSYAEGQTLIDALPDWKGKFLDAFEKILGVI